MMMLSLGRLLVAVTLAVPALGHPRPHALHPLHHPPLSRSVYAEELFCRAPVSPFDYSAKIRQREELPFCSLAEAPVSSLLVTRQASEPDDYSCSETRPCRNGACCPKKTGFCQYGPEACGTTGTSPNDVCWNNCDAHAECGKNALPVGKTCPLNVCCSEFGFCGATADFCKVSSDPDKSCQSNCEQPGSGASGGNVQQRVIGYYEAWAHDRTCQNMNFNDIPAGALTHAYFSFAFITPGTFMIAPMDGLDPDLFSDFTAIKKNNAGLKTVVAIGGWSFNDPGPTLTTFSDLVSTAANRQTFIGNLMAFMRKYGFDGVDFDWEYPGAPDRGGRPDDGKNLAIFLEELARVNDQQAERYIVSFTVPTSYWYLRWFDMTAFEHIDFVNVMSYDLHGVWDSSNPIGNHIYGHSNLTEIKLALDLFWRNGVPASKLNLGLGFYGRSFQLSDPTCFRPGCQFRAGASPGPCSQNSGTLTYREIQDIISQYELVPYHDETAAVKYITWNEDQWVSYDDAETFKQKIDFANNLGLGGLLIWAIDQDTDDLEALRGVVGDNNLKLYAKRSDNAAYWEGVSVPDCYVSDCGGSCKSGFLSVTHQPCGGAKPVTRRAKEADSQLCCPLAGTPSASDCTWRGNDPACNGHCQENEVAVQLNKWGDGWYCEGGHKAYCCKTDIQNTCYWTGAGDRCRGDDEALTFAGTFRQRLADLAGLFGGLVGLVLEDALNQANVDMLKLYCCPKQDVGNWQQCQWYGTPGDCSDNHCPIGHSVQLTDSAYGLGEDCGIHLERSRVFCCDAAEGRSPFLPVDLGKLFPSPPSGDQVDTEFELETDDTWGSGSSKTGGADEPEDAAFNFVVLSSPEPLQISLDKRDGSHWELFNCTETDSEEAQTIQMVCTDVSENSNCHKIGLGHGVPGTILQMPKRCGPGKYAVAVDMVKSPHQILPRSVSHLGHKPVIYDLTFDYDFARVPRDLGNTQMRIDYSNQPGYWDKVVSAAASRKRKVKTKTRSLHEDFGGDHIQWLEAEFRDDMHLSSGDALSEDELHKRWFASGIIDWLSNMLSPEISKTFRHVIDNTYVLKVVDAHWTCPLHSGGLLVQAETNVHVETSFGFTLICTLGPPGSFIDLSQSYLTFTNNGEITAIFRLEAFLNLHYDSGEKTLIEIPFPGASFYIPGIATIGPQLNLKARIEASALLSAVMETKVDIASWEFSQTLPPNDEYKPSEPDAVDFGRTGDFSGIQQPTFYAGIQAEGQVRAHAIAEVAFGVSFVDRWNIGRATASVVADGWVEVEARASASTAGNCPFTWGLTAGVDLYAMAEAPQQFKWQLPKYPLPGSGQTTIKPLGECPVPGDGAPARRAVRSVDGLPLPQHDLAVGNGSLDQGHRTLQRRDRIPIGPVWDIPAEKLLCPNSAGAGDTSIACADITGWEDEDVQNALRRRDDDGEWHVLGKRSTQSGRVVMGCARKLQFKAPPYETSGTLGSKFAPKVYGYVRPDVCTDWDFDGDRPLPPSTETEKKWATEHILELQLIPLFFDWLDSKLGATLPEYVPGSTDRTRRLCQVLRTYWYKVPQASRFTMDPGAATRDPVDHVTAVFPSNNEHGDEFVLLDSGVNTAKERMFSDDQNVVREEVITAWLQHSQNRAIKNVKDMMTAMKYLQDTTIAQRLITEKERVGTRLNELDTDKLVNWARKSRAGADFPTWQSLDLETHWNTYMAEKGKAASKKAVLHIDNMLEQIKDAYATASHRKNAQAAADAANPDLSLQLFIDKYDAIVTEWARYKPLAWTNPF